MTHIEWGERSYKSVKTILEHWTVQRSNRGDTAPSLLWYSAVTMFYKPAMVAAIRDGAAQNYVTLCHLFYRERLLEYRSSATLY